MSGFRTEIEQANRKLKFTMMFAGTIRKVQLEVINNLLSIIFHSNSTWVQKKIEIPPDENPPPTFMIACTFSSNSQMQMTTWYLKKWGKGIANHILCPQQSQSVTYSEFLKTCTPTCIKHIKCTSC